MTVIRRVHKYKVGDILVRGDGGEPNGEFTVTALDWGNGLPFYFGDEKWARAGVWESDILGRKGGGGVDHPAHYNSHPSGVECIVIARHHNFNIGNVFKYLWRLGLKDSAGKSKKEKTLQDIDKAIWYLQDERKRVEEEWC